MYIIEGPRTIGNLFAYYGRELPPGRFIIVEDGEYCNGGYGPSASSSSFRSRETAEKALAEMEAGSA